MRYSRGVFLGIIKGHMNTETIVLAAVSMLGWGVGAFFSKLATNHIGEKSVFWDMVGYVPFVILYCFFTFRSKAIFSSDKMGIIYALIAGAVGSVGIIAFYLLIAKKDAGIATAVTALYPAVTAILSFVFLGEKLTLLKGIGITLASVALFLLAL